MENEKQENKDWCEKLLNKTEEQINKVLEDGLNTENVTYLGKIVDIHKDLKNEKYWKEKLIMRYRYNEYDNYGGGRRRDSQGRYMGMDDSYGRHNRRYRGHEILDNVYDTYGEYENNHTYGNYGGNETKNSLKEMLNSIEDFFGVIMEQAESPEEIRMVKETAKRISDM